MTTVQQVVALLDLLHNYTGNHPTALSLGQVERLSKLGVHLQIQGETGYARFDALERWWGFVHKAEHQRIYAALLAQRIVR